MACRGKPPAQRGYQITKGLIRAFAHRLLERNALGDFTENSRGKGSLAFAERLFKPFFGVLWFVAVFGNHILSFQPGIELLFICPLEGMSYVGISHPYPTFEFRLDNDCFDLTFLPAVTHQIVFYFSFDCFSRILFCTTTFLVEEDESKPRVAAISIDQLPSLSVTAVVSIGMANDVEGEIAG